MSGGLNKKLINNTDDFLRRYAIKTQSHYFYKKQQDNTNALSSGDYAVDLVPAPNEPHPAVYLQVRSRWGKLSHQLDCFFLSAKPNNVNSFTLPSDVDWFFTDLLTGCQFLIYGSPDRPTVEHNNSLDGSVDYGACLANAQRGGLLIRVSPGEQYDATGGECAVVVGHRQGGAWQFYMQRIDAAQKIHLTKFDSF